MKRPPHHEMSEAFGAVCMALELAEPHLPEPTRSVVTKIRRAKLSQYNEARAALLDQMAALEAPEAAE